MSVHEIESNLDAVEDYYRPATVLDYLGHWLKTHDFAPDDLLFTARRTRVSINDTVLAAAHRPLDAG